MKTSFAVALLLLASVACSAAEDSKVVVLDADNFDENIAKSKLTLVEFYAPWCGHCKALAPEYDKAAESLEGKDSGVLAKVDCTEHRDLCSKYGVRGFPTVKLFRNDGSEPGDYDQARTADAIVKYMLKQNQPAITELADVDAAKKFTSGTGVKVLAVFKDDTNVDGFTSVANGLRNEYDFGLIKSSAAAEEYGVSVPAILVTRDFDEPQVTFDGDVTDGEAIKKFVVAQSFPLVGTIGPENYAKYVERGLNFVWIFYDPDSQEQKELIEKAVAPVASEHRSELSFVKLDGKRWGEHAKSFGLSGGTPGIVVEDRDKRKNYVLPENDKVTVDAFRTFIEGYLDGSLAPTIKSEPIPEKNDDPVTVIVGKTFDDIVLDDSKDVFVEFYAPWCGHCKNLAPKYEELGKIFKEDDGVVIAKIDATANDSPADVQGFPTLIFYPAGEKASPKHFNGERTAEGMASWIRENRRTKAPEGGASHTEL